MATVSDTYVENREREQTTESYFVFVAVDDDDDMRPTEVPDLAVSSDRCRDLREEALDGEHE